MSSWLNASGEYDYDYPEIEGDDGGELCVMSSNHSVELVVGPYIHPIICVLGSVGNGLVIITYIFYKRTKSTTDVYLLNVAVSDLMFIVTLPLTTYDEQLGWLGGAAACKTLHGAYSVNLYSCMLLLACISADRYLAIVHARRRCAMRSLRYGRVISGVVWVTAFLLSLPSFLYYQYYRPSHAEPPQEGAESDGHICDFKFPDAESARLMKILIPSVQMALGFFLPLFVMVLCYSCVVHTLLGGSGFQRQRAVRVVLAVVVVFVACHLPYNVALLYDTLLMFREQGCGEVNVLEVVKVITKTLAFLHCCLNPVLYAFVGVKFRGHLRKIVEDLCCVGRRSVARRCSSRVTSDTYVSTRRSVTSSSFTM